MANEFIPPPDLAPPSVKHLSLAKRIELWKQLVDDCEALLLAGLRRMEDRENEQIQFLENLSRRERGCGN